jgi:hypothetical protein
MSQTATVEQLAERVESLEQAVVVIKCEMAEVRSKPTVNGQADRPALFADKQMVRQAFAEFMAVEGVDVQPVGIEKLREMMKQAGLSNLRMSDELIAMRNE